MSTPNAWPHRGLGRLRGQGGHVHCRQVHVQGKQGRGRGQHRCATHRCAAKAWCCITGCLCFSKYAIGVQLTETLSSCTVTIHEAMDCTEKAIALLVFFHCIILRPRDRKRSVAHAALPQLRRPEEPPPKRRIVVKDDDGASDASADGGSDAPSDGGSDDSIGSGLLP